MGLGKPPRDVPGGTLQAVGEITPVAIERCQKGIWVHLSFVKELWYWVAFEQRVVSILAIFCILYWLGEGRPGSTFLGACMAYNRAEGSYRITSLSIFFVLADHY